MLKIVFLCLAASFLVNWPDKRHLRIPTLVFVTTIVLVVVVINLDINVTFNV